MSDRPTPEAIEAGAAAAGDLPAPAPVPTPEPAPTAGLSLAHPSLVETDPLVVSRVAALAARLKTDPALRVEVLDFLDEAIQFVRDGSDAVATLGPRTCRLTGDAVVLGRTDYPQTKRIPL